MRPTTMRAARIHEFGDASVIRYENAPRPSPGPGEVLVQVAAAAYNPSDIGLRAGFLQALLPVTLPAVLGVDVSGTVVELGSDVDSWRLGDAVIGMVDGSMAEYVVAKANLLVAAPASITLTDAAAIPIAALTAWQAVFEQAQLQPGQRVLINGAGGGVGMFAVALAKHAGAWVAATASPRSAAAVHRYGADQIIDYTAAEAGVAIGVALGGAIGGGVDVLINLVPTEISATLPVIRPGGVLVCLTGPVQPPPDVTVRSMITRNDPAQLAELVRLVDAGTLVVDVTERHALADLARVHRRSEAGQIRGKAILVPSDPSVGETSAPPGHAVS